MKITGPLAAFFVSVLLGSRAILGTIGDASTINDILGFLSPEARAVIMADSTWTALASVAFLWLAYELRRDLGKGQEALFKAQEAIKEAQDSNLKAWAFSGEFRQIEDELKECLSEAKSLSVLYRDKFKTLEPDIEIFKLQRINAHANYMESMRSDLDSRIKMQVSEIFSTHQRELKFRNDVL